MRVALYNRWLPTLGGGERHCLSIACALARLQHEVVVLSETHVPKALVSDRFDLQLDDVSFECLGSCNADFISSTSSQFGLFLNCCATKDLVIPRSPLNVALVFFPSPLKEHRLGVRAASARIARYDAFWANSVFTTRWIQAYWNVNADVLYPLIDNRAFFCAPKRRQILSVGRFFSERHNKQHVMMINAFKEADRHELKGWTLFLVGAVKDNSEDRKYLREVQKLAVGSPIQVISNASFSLLRELYARSALYWHATGFGEDETAAPEKCEHFGITTVEAMASGCVPIVFPAGGQREIVTHLHNGMHWQSVSELISQSCCLATDDNLRQVLAAEAITRARSFGESAFGQRLAELMQKLPNRYHYRHS